MQSRRTLPPALNSLFGWLHRLFDATATWVSQLSWWKFFLFAALALIAGKILQDELFSGGGEEVVVRSDKRAKKEPESNIQIDESGIRFNPRGKLKRDVPAAPEAPEPPEAPEAPAVPEVPATPAPQARQQRGKKRRQKRGQGSRRQGHVRRRSPHRPAAANRRRIVQRHRGSGRRRGRSQGVALPQAGIDLVQELRLPAGAGPVRHQGPGGRQEAGGSADPDAPTRPPSANRCSASCRKRRCR